MAHPPRFHLTLDNFTLDSEVPANCPFVLTSPRSLEACGRAGVQPVSLLPTTLREYEEALPDLSREKVLAIFREVETAKEVKLTNCREHRRQIIWEDENGNGDDQEIGVRQRFKVGRGTRKLSCLSPIVEYVGGRDSALGTSHSGTVSGIRANQSGVSELSTSQLVTVSAHATSQSGSMSSLNSCQPTRVSDEDRNSPEQPIVPGILVSTPPILGEDTIVSDQPESDQHVNFPIFHQQLESDVLLENTLGSDQSLVDLENSLSCESLESDIFDSDLVFSESPSPVRDLSASFLEDWRSCPELNRERVDSFSDLSQRDFEIEFSENMENNLSKSAHTLKALDVGLANGSQTYRRTSSRSKKKASRAERLTSESLQSLYDASNNLCPDKKCPESERICTFNVGQTKSGGCSEPLSPFSTQSSKSPWPHKKSMTGVSPASSCLVRTVLSRSDIDIDQMQISQQDMRILEILAIRNIEEHDHRKKQQRLRIQWEEEKCKRDLEKNELEKEYRKNLTAKRRKENDECQIRLHQARERFIRSQDHLRQLLKDKDDRKKELVTTICRKKESLVREHREQEEGKRVAVDDAVKDLLNRDTLYRNELKKQVEEKLKKAERNRKKQEINRAMSLTESNRLENRQHQLRVKKLEEIYEDHIKKIKITIEKKLKQASDLLKLQEQSQKLNSSKYEESYAKTLALKAELEAGLDLWRKQVLSVQSQSIRRVEEKVRHELESRREKLAAEMRNTEQKCLEKRKEKDEEKKMRILNAKKKIEEKENKVEKLLSERGKSIIRARKMAETSAKLRELIKTVNQ